MFLKKANNIEKKWLAGLVIVHVYGIIW